VEYTDQTDYVAISDKSTSCSSYVGRVGGKQMVYLSDPDCVYTVRALFYLELLLMHKNRSHQIKFYDLFRLFLHANIKEARFKNNTQTARHCTHVIPRFNFCRLPYPQVDIAPLPLAARISASGEIVGLINIFSPLKGREYRGNSWLTWR